MALVGGDLVADVSVVATDDFYPWRVGGGREISRAFSGCLSVKVSVKAGEVKGGCGIFAAEVLGRVDLGVVPQLASVLPILVYSFEDSDACVDPAFLILFGFFDGFFNKALCPS